MTKKKAQELVDTLIRKFGGEGEFEAVDSAKGRYRFALTSRKFERMPHLKRQDAIWAVVDKVLNRQDRLDISLILAYAPSELVA